MIKVCQRAYFTRKKTEETLVCEHYML